MKASKEITVMAIKQCTKRHTRYFMDLANRRMMLMATKYRIKPLSTMCVDSDATPVDSFLKFSAARASLAQGQSPA
jgi:hypothetical protein